MYLALAEDASQATRSLNTVASVPPTAGSIIEYPSVWWTSAFAPVDFCVGTFGARAILTTSSPGASGTVHTRWLAVPDPFEQSTHVAATSATRRMALAACMAASRAAGDSPLASNIRTTRANPISVYIARHSVEVGGRLQAVCDRGHSSLDQWWRACDN